MLKVNIRNENKTDHLVITLNTGGKFNLRDLTRDNVQVLPKGFNWYITKVPEKARQLVDIIRKTGHKRVVLVGSSKTGFAAILLAAVASPLAPEIDFRVCTYAPVTYFHNGEKFLKRMSSNLRRVLDEGKLYNEIEMYGDLNKPLSKTKGNIKILDVYSSTSSWVEDLRYARHIDRWPFVRTKHIPWESFKGHIHPNGKRINVHKIMAYFWVYARDQFYMHLDEALAMTDKEV